MAYGKGNMSKPMKSGGGSRGNDGYSSHKSKPSYDSNANVTTSRLNAGGDKKWRGTRGKKGMSYK